MLYLGKHNASVLQPSVEYGIAKTHLWAIDCVLQRNLFSRVSSFVRFDVCVLLLLYATPVYSNHVYRCKPNYQSCALKGKKEIPTTIWNLSI